MKMESFGGHNAAASSVPLLTFYSYQSKSLFGAGIAYDYVRTLKLFSYNL